MTTMPVKESSSEPASKPVFENIDEVINAASFDEDNCVDDFFDQLDQDIDNYFGNLHKK